VLRPQTIGGHGKPCPYKTKILLSLLQNSVSCRFVGNLSRKYRTAALGYPFRMHRRRRRRHIFSGEAGYSKAALYQVALIKVIFEEEWVGGALATLFSPVEARLAVPETKVKVNETDFHGKAGDCHQKPVWWHFGIMHGARCAPYMIDALWGAGRGV